MKKLFFLGTCLVALASSPVQAQTGGAELVVVQLYYTGVSTLHIAITRADGQTEDIEVKDAGNTKEHVAASAMQRTLTKLVREGYTLKNSFALGGSQVPTLFFEKRQ